MGFCSSEGTAPIFSRSDWARSRRAGGPPAAGAASYVGGISNDFEVVDRAHLPFLRPTLEPQRDFTHRRGSYKLDCARNRAQFICAQNPVNATLQSGHRVHI